MEGFKPNKNEAFITKIEGPTTLYHFTLDADRIREEGFRSSKYIDNGIGSNGNSLVGTYFFTTLEDMDRYQYLLDHTEKRYGKRGKRVVAELSSDANILDSSTDDSVYFTEYWEFAKSTELQRNTPEFFQEFTKFLKAKGYDAIKIRESLLGDHIEVIVINEEKLIYKGEL